MPFRILLGLGMQLLILFLLGCQGAEGYVDALVVTGTADPSTATSVLDVTDDPLPTSALEATDTPVPTPMLSPTPSVTPTPFVCPQQNGKIFRDVFTSEAMQTEEIRYMVYVPPCYSHYQDRAFPTLYLLHGWPMDERHWENLGIVDIMDAWISQGLIGPMIAVMPGVSNPHGMYINSSGGDHSFEGMVVNELVPMVDQQYRTWQTPEGRAIGGISRGGVWSLEIGFRHPDLFGTVGAHSPALSVNHPLPVYDPFNMVESIDPAQRIYLSAGDQDWARAWTLKLRDLLQEHDVLVNYKVHEGAHINDLWRLGLPDYLHFYTLEWPGTAEDLPLTVRGAPTPVLEDDLRSIQLFLEKNKRGIMP